MMDKINKEGIAICKKAYEVMRDSENEFEHAFLEPDFVKTYTDFEVWANNNGITGKGELITPEKYLAYVKLYGKEPMSHSKTFSSIRHSNSRVCQTRTTMIMNEDGKILTMPRKTMELAEKIILKGLKND